MKFASLNNFLLALISTNLSLDASALEDSNQDFVFEQRFPLDAYFGSQPSSSPPPVSLTTPPVALEQRQSCIGYNGFCGGPIDWIDCCDGLVCREDIPGSLTCERLDGGPAPTDPPTDPPESNCDSEINAVAACLDQSGSREPCVSCVSDAEKSIFEGAETVACNAFETEICAAIQSDACECGTCADEVEALFACTYAECDIECPIDNTICFSGNVEVMVEGAGATRVGDLKIGDAVLTGDGSYSEVYSFAHFAPNELAKYLQIKAQTMDKPLEISEPHMIFKYDEESKKKTLVAAKDIKVGDALVTGQHAPVVVKSIRSVTRNGAYNPLTKSGDVVVNGVVASNYIILSPSFAKHVSPHLQHLFEHAAMTPYRTFCGLFGCESEIYDEVTGVPSYVMKWMSLVDFMEHHNLVVPVLLISGCITTLWVPFNFWSVLAVLVGFYVWKKTNEHVCVL